MATSPEGGPGRSRYPFLFGISAALLALATLVLVLVVLPNRYVLSSGFQESGVNFPVTAEPLPAGAVVRREAPPRPAPLPVVDERVPRGPAELFWEAVLPLLAEERYEDALPLFPPYLEAHPDDRGALREYAVTLFRAGRTEEAVAVLTRLLEEREDPELRLVLARTLRDVGRMEAASAQYALLQDEGVEGRDLALEWARSLSWVELYDDAIRILEEALSRTPDDPELQVELARIHYYSGRLELARTLLAGMDRETLARLDALGLQADVVAALTPPAEEVPTPTLVEQAAAAREAGNLAAAARLLEEALAEDPSDLAAWQARADLLQYELDDLPGALAALREVERLGPDDPALQFRIAQLEIWTGDDLATGSRLEALLARIEGGGPLDLPPVEGTPRTLTAGQVEALLGDLLRWQGEREAAAERYEAALRREPGRPEAMAGLAALREAHHADVHRAEDPHLGSRASALADTEEFRRVEVGAEWAGVRKDWSWGVSAGNRWVEGFDPAGALASHSGLFAQVDAGRWWRWGQLRTGVRLGVETVRPGATDLSLGASLRVPDLGEVSLELAYDRGPAYTVTSTLQAVFLDVVQDALRVSLSGQLTQVWSLWVEAQGARMEPRALPSEDASVRWQGALALEGALWQGVSLGLAGQVVGFTAASPVVGTRRAWWDPRLATSLGPFARLERELSPLWTVTGRVTAGVALLDERPGSGLETVPHLLGEAGLHYTQDRFTASLELFYQQSRFQGYRSWGGRLSIRILDLWEGGVP